MTDATEPTVWMHGDVSCNRCGYDSKRAGERHVWQSGWDKLECPHCRSYDCRPVWDDEDTPEPPTLEFEVPENASNLLTAVAVCSGLNKDGEPEAWVLGDADIRKIETLGLLTFGLEAVKDRMLYGGEED